MLTTGRNSPWLDFMVTSQRQLQFMREYSLAIFLGTADWFSGCDPLTPDDIAELIVFAAGRRENVVLADSLIFPNHQVGFILLFSVSRLIKSGLCHDHAQEVIDVLTDCRLELAELCIRGRSLSRAYSWLD